MACLRFQDTVSPLCISRLSSRFSTSDGGVQPPSSGWTLVMPFFSPFFASRGLLGEEGESKEVMVCRG